MHTLPYFHDFDSYLQLHLIWLQYSFVSKFGIPMLSEILGDAGERTLGLSDESKNFYPEEIN